MVCAVCVGVGGCAGGGPQGGVSACGLSRETETESVSLFLSLLSLSLCLRVCMWICVGAYDELGSGAMADPCLLACALGVIWCVLCAWVAAVVLVVDLSR
eukprot:COSAG06_NODE_8357_length_2191_cov_36.212888_3_plen_100_part_00